MINRGMESKRISMGSGGAPLPSPEEETKWQQQFPLPLQMQDDLMSTSFGTDRDWDSQDEDEGDDDGEDGEEDEEENSSSSGEFVWKVIVQQLQNFPKIVFHISQPSIDEIVESLYNNQYSFNNLRLAKLVVQSFFFQPLNNRYFYNFNLI